jgi:hypothetical protein
MKMKINILSYCKFLATVIVCGTGLFCSSQPTHTNGGSGTEAPNALILISDSGRLYGTSHLVVVAGAYDSAYVPYNDSGFDTLIPSDVSGRFNFGPMKTGTYNVVVTEADSGKAAFFSTVRVDPSAGPDTFRSVLGAVGSFSGEVRDSVGATYPTLPVFILGSPFFDKVDINGLFSIDHVPAGDFHVLTKRIILTPQGLSKSDTLMADTACGLSGGESKSVGILMLKEQ